MESNNLLWVLGHYLTYFWGFSFVTVKGLGVSGITVTSNGHKHPAWWLFCGVILWALSVKSLVFALPNRPPPPCLNTAGPEHPKPCTTECDPILCYSSVDPRVEDGVRDRVPEQESLAGIELNPRIPKPCCCAHETHLAAVRMKPT